MLSLSALTACAAGGGGGGALGSGTTLVVATSQAPWNPAYEAVVKAYEEKTGVTVDLRSFPNDDVKTQQRNDIQGQTRTYDVFQINESDMVSFLEDELVQPFSEIDSSFTLDPEVFTYDSLPYWNADTQAFDADGELTSVPLMGNLHLFMYRTDVYDALGLDVPTTWDDIVANGRAALDAGETEYGGVFRTQGTPGSASTTFDFQAIFNAEGAQWFADEGTDWTPQVNSEAGVRAATIYRQLAELGPSATTTIGQGQALATMQAGEAAETFLVAATGAAMESESDSSVVGKVGYAALPATPSGTAGSATGVWSLAVPVGLSEERSAAALDFIAYVSSKEAMEIFAENGGIPTRSDAFAPEGISEASEQILNAAKETAENDPQGQLRWSFSQKMLGFTESILEDIAAGKVSPQDGMDDMQAQLTALIQAENLPMK
ncbi:extracellular solute-binding protein [Okibacterium endophyticum]